MAMIKKLLVKLVKWQQIYKNHKEAIINDMACDLLVESAKSIEEDIKEMELERKEDEQNLAALVNFDAAATEEAIKKMQAQVDSIRGHYPAEMESKDMALEDHNIILELTARIADLMSFTNPKSRYDRQKATEDGIKVQTDSIDQSKKSSAQYRLAAAQKKQTGATLRMQADFMRNRY